MRKRSHFAAAVVAIGCFVFLNASGYAQDQNKDKDRDRNTSATDQNKTSPADPNKTGASSTDQNKTSPADQTKPGSSTDPNRSKPTDQNKTPANSDQTTATSPTTNPPSSTASNLNSSDRNFAMKAAQGGMAEVEFGKLAQQKASSEDVKNFANRMVEDHQKANDELKQWAGKKNVTLPTDGNVKDKATMDRLSALSGPALDKAYMQYMLKDHKKDVSEFQRESNRASDPDLKAWASKTLPTLQDHLRMAQEVNGKTARMSSGKLNERSRTDTATTTTDQNTTKTTDQSTTTTTKDKNLDQPKDKNLDQPKDKNLDQPKDKNKPDQKQDQ